VLEEEEWNYSLIEKFNFSLTFIRQVKAGDEADKV
jgi:hypothetical protein